MSLLPRRFSPLAMVSGLEHLALDGSSGGMLMETTIRPARKAWVALCIQHQAAGVPISTLDWAAFDMFQRIVEYAKDFAF